MNIEVKQISLEATANTGTPDRVDRAPASSDRARWGLYVNGILIGDSKNRFDADHAKVMLEKAIGVVTASEMLDMIVGSLKGYPDHGGDIRVMTEVERIVREALGRVRDVDEYLKMIATAGEEFPGERNEARRKMVIQAAAGAADRIILHYADGSVEDLEYLTAHVAKEFFEKMVLATQMALARKEFLQTGKPVTAEDVRHVPTEEEIRKARPGLFESDS